MIKTKIFLVAILIIACISLFGQTQVPENSSSPIYHKDGMVGIGVSSPLKNLTIRKNGSTLRLETESKPSHYFLEITSNYDWANPTTVLGYSSFPILKQANGDDILKLYSNNIVTLCLNKGLVGVGTTSPKSKLDVSGGDITIRNSRINSAESLGRINWRNNYATTERDAARIDVLTKSTGSGAWDYTEMTFSTWNGYNSLSEKMRIASNGNVGIGTNTPDYKLDVEGTIRTRELKVDMQGADFVFEDDYQLRSLEEVHEFITANKHLPDVAPAKEMQENGVNQSEMNQLLLQKIEELTLYIIKQDQRIQELEKLNQQ